MEYRISVIVPVYNVEKYLRQCLKSILNQSLSDIEIIVVNDGSEDGSAQIIDEYANKYNNIVVINKENGGLSSARNHGIKIARGKYISFIDSDDYISCDMLEKMYTEAINTDAEIIICGYKYCNEEGENIQACRNFNYNSNFNKEKLIEGILTNNISSIVCDKIYKKDLFLKNAVQFPEGKYFEDTETVFKLILSAEKVSVLNEKLYYYRLRDGSITNIKSLKMIYDYIDGISSINTELKKNSLLDRFAREFQCFCIIKIFQSAIFLYEYIIKNSKSIDRSKLLKDFYRQIPGISIFDAIRNKHLSTRDRLKFVLFKLKFLYIFKHVQIRVSSLGML